jgi:hypothetical protein
MHLFVAECVLHLSIGKRPMAPQQMFFFDKKTTVLELGTFMPKANSSPTYNETQNCDMEYTGVKLYANKTWQNLPNDAIIANEFDDGIIYSLLNSNGQNNGGSCVLESVDDKACVKVLTQMTMEFGAATPPVTLPFNITAACS